MVKHVVPKWFLELRLKYLFYLLLFKLICRCNQNWSMTPSFPHIRGLAGIELTFYISQCVFGFESETMLVASNFWLLLSSACTLWTFCLCYPLHVTPSDYAGSEQTLGGSTTRRANPNWPSSCYIPCSVLHDKKSWAW